MNKKPLLHRKSSSASLTGKEHGATHHPSNKKLSRSASSASLTFKEHGATHPSKHVEPNHSPKRLQTPSKRKSETHTLNRLPAKRQAKPGCLSQGGCFCNKMESFLVSLLSLCNGDSTITRPCNGAGCTRPLGPDNEAQREIVDLWSGYLWKLNSSIDMTEEKEVNQLRNWRLRKFILSEYTDAETGVTSGLLSYMSEKLEGVSHLSFELTGDYTIDPSADFPVIFSQMEANKTRLDNETYEVAFGQAGGSLQSKHRKERHIPDHFYAFKINAGSVSMPNDSGDNLLNEIVLATTVARDRRLWVDRLEMYSPDETEPPQVPLINLTKTMAQGPQSPHKKMLSKRPSNVVEGEK